MYTLFFHLFLINDVFPSLTCRQNIQLNLSLFFHWIFLPFEEMTGTLFSKFITTWLHIPGSKETYCPLSLITKHLLGFILTDYSWVSPLWLMQKNLFPRNKFMAWSNLLTLWVRYEKRHCGFCFKGVATLSEMHFLVAWLQCHRKKFRQ